MGCLDRSFEALVELTTRLEDINQDEARKIVEQATPKDGPNTNDRPWRKAGNQQP